MSDSDWERNSEEARNPRSRDAKRRIKDVKNAFHNSVERQRIKAVWGLVSSTGLTYAEVLKIWNEEE